MNVVLCRTIYSKNIGASARAMANMGVDRLILVDPKCAIDSKARQGAAGARAMLESHVTYASFAEFRQAEAGIYVAMSKRTGKYRDPKPLQWVLDYIDAQNEMQPIYFLFGPEDDGLSTEEIERTHLTACLPTHGEFQSLNLAQAVLLTLFIARKKWPRVDNQRSVGVENRALMDELDGLIQQWLQAMGFQLDHRQGSALKVSRKLMLQGLPAEFELKIFNAIMKQNIQMLQGDRHDHLLNSSVGAVMKDDTR